MKQLSFCVLFAGAKTQPSTRYGYCRPISLVTQGSDSTRLIKDGLFSNFNYAFNFLLRRFSLISFHLWRFINLSMTNRSICDSQRIIVRIQILYPIFSPIMLSTIVGYVNQLTVATEHVKNSPLPQSSTSFEEKKRRGTRQLWSGLGGSSVTEGISCCVPSNSVSIALIGIHVVFKQKC